MADFDSKDGGKSVWDFAPVINPELPPLVFRKATTEKLQLSTSPMRFFARGYDARPDIIDNAISDLECSPILNQVAIDAAMEPLNNLKGLQTFKDTIRHAIINWQLQKIRALAKMKPRQARMHFVFMGEPGTGKTTAARQLAKVLLQCGYVKSGVFLEVNRSDLVGEYLGETDQKVRRVLKRVKSGVLFIDEAYALNKSGSHSDYGHDVIDLLVAEMERPTFDTVIICAGYEPEMKAFLNSNPGLKSRFTHSISFPRPGIEMLMDILDGMTAEAEYKFSPQARIKCEAILRERLRLGETSESNIRGLRQMLDQAITRQTMRIWTMYDPKIRDLSVLLPEDIPGEAAIPPGSDKPADSNIVAFKS